MSCHALKAAELGRNSQITSTVQRRVVVVLSQIRTILPLSGRLVWHSDSANLGLVAQRHDSIEKSLPCGNLSNIVQKDNLASIFSETLNEGRRGKDDSLGVQLTSRLLPHGHRVIFLFPRRSESS